MYECDSCGKRFSEPKYAYSRDKPDGTIQITTSDYDGFEPMSFLHEDSSCHCPFCGSDTITDLNDLT